GPDFALLEQLAGECFMPLAYGGGIGSVQTARDVMKCGVEKVILNSAAWRKPELVSDVASVLGSSSTMVSLDVQKSRGVPRRFDHVSHSVDKKSNLSDDVKAMIAAGAGELLVQSVERDGTMSGPDLQLLRDVAGNLPIPVVYAGGVSSLHDASDIWNLGVSGVAAGAWFVFRGPHRAVLITYPGYDDIVASYSCENR
ncbi:MAG: HisA/HisF-related TIM barrel protein, partial [Terrimesophilobacter sp.]